MSKLIFEDKSCIEIKKSNDPDKIIISIQAKDVENSLKKIINSVEITAQEWQQLISDIK